MLIIYALAIFVSALLLFIVEPMFARMILPLLGGSPSVWNTAVVFYQAMLLFGYIYAHAATRWLGVRRQLMAMALSPFVAQKLGTFVNSENAADLVALTELIEAGTVTPAVDRTFPLSEAPAAVRYMREGQARGKVVIDV